MIDARMRHFATLDQTQQKQAVTRLAVLGMSDHGIAHATQLSVEFIRLVLADSESANSASCEQIPTPLCSPFEKPNAVMHLPILASEGDEL